MSAETKALRAAKREQKKVSRSRPGRARCERKEGELRDRKAEYRSELEQEVVELRRLCSELEQEVVELRRRLQRKNSGPKDIDEMTIMHLNEEVARLTTDDLYRELKKDLATLPQWHHEARTRQYYLKIMSKCMPKNKV